MLPVEYSGEPEVELEGEKAHYLVRVLRLGRDDSFPAIDAAGNHYHCTIRRLEPTLVLRVQRKGAVIGDRPRIRIVQSIPKGRKIDGVIRRCTEAGIAELQPVLSDHTVVRLTDEDVPGKLSRWKRIATEAVQQSGTPFPVTILPPKPLDRYLSELSGSEKSLRLMLHQAPLANCSLHRYVAESDSEPVGALSLELAVGPEGGFSERELAIFRSARYKPVYLGPQVLRTETAALYATAAIQIILLERSEWRLKK